MLSASIAVTLPSMLTPPPPNPNRGPCPDPGSKLPPARKNVPPRGVKALAAAGGAVARPAAKATPPIARTAAPMRAMSIRRLDRRRLAAGGGNDTGAGASARATSGSAAAGGVGSSVIEGSPSFVAEGGDRIEPSRLAGQPDAEHDPGAHAPGRRRTHA